LTDVDITTQQIHECINRAQRGEKIVFVWPHYQSLDCPTSIAIDAKGFTAYSKRMHLFLYEATGHLAIIPIGACEQFRDTRYRMVLDHSCAKICRSTDLKTALEILQSLESKNAPND